MGTYSDGEFGTYIDTIETFSRDCGYNVGSGGSNSETTIDPNLAITDDGMILFDTLNSEITGEIVLDVPNTRPPGPVYPIADSVISFSCSGNSKIAVLANGSGGSYTKNTGYSADCGPLPFFLNGIDSGATKYTESSTLNYAFVPNDYAVSFDSTAYNTSFVPAVFSSKTSAKLELDISYGSFGASSAPSIGFNIFTSTSVYTCGFYFTLNRTQTSSSNSPSSVSSNTLTIPGYDLPANALPTSGRQLITLLVEPSGGYLKFTFIINGTTVQSVTTDVVAVPFTPGIYLRSCSGVIYDFTFVNYP